MKITPSTVTSYFSCEREAWFMHNNIIPDQKNPFIELGRFIHETSYKDKGEHSISLPSMKIDLMWKEKDVTIVGEIKKSSRTYKGAKWQLLYYLYELKKRGIVAKGKLLIPKERKTIEIVLDEKAKKQLESYLNEIEKIVSKDTPPEATYKSICQKCAYKELCWA